MQSVPRKIFLPTQNADATAHTSPRVHLQPVFWSQVDASEGFRWILTKDDGARGGGCPKRVGKGASHCSGHVYAYPWDAFTEVTQAGGGEAQFLGLLQVVVPELFWLWPNCSKQKTSWPTKPTTHAHFPVGKNFIIAKEGEEKYNQNGHAANTQDKTINKNSEK